jgi:hypothetical protein
MPTFFPSVHPLSGTCIARFHDAGCIVIDSRRVEIPGHRHLASSPKGERIERSHNRHLVGPWSVRSEPCSWNREIERSRQSMKQNKQIQSNVVESAWVPTTVFVSIASVKMRYQANVDATNR